MRTPDTELIQRACALLARREYARSELREKLIRLGAPSQAAESVVEYLETTGAQSDRRFTEEYVRIHVDRGEGPLKIIHALEARGITRERVEVELDRPDAIWITRAERARVKRFGPNRPMDADSRERQSHFLLGRGFTPRVVSGLWQGWGLEILSDANGLEAGPIGC